MRKEIADLIHEAMEQHELARDFYHRLAHRVAHADTRETFEYLAKEAEEHGDKLRPRGEFPGVGPCQPWLST
jgi:rubrerythrin